MQINIVHAYIRTHFAIEFDSELVNYVYASMSANKYLACEHVHFELIRFRAQARMFNLYIFWLLIALLTAPALLLCTELSSSPARTPGTHAYTYVAIYIY